MKVKNNRCKKQRRSQQFSKPSAREKFLVAARFLIFEIFSFSKKFQNCTPISRVLFFRPSIFSRRCRRVFAAGNFIFKMKPVEKIKFPSRFARKRGLPNFAETKFPFRFRKIKNSRRFTSLVSAALSVRDVFFAAAFPLEIVLVSSVLGLSSREISRAVDSGCNFLKSGKILPRKNLNSILGKSNSVKRRSALLKKVFVFFFKLTI